MYLWFSIYFFSRHFWGYRPMRQSPIYYKTCHRIYLDEITANFFETYDGWDIPTVCIKSSWRCLKSLCLSGDIKFHERYLTILTTCWSPHQAQGRRAVCLVTAGDHFDLPTRLCIGTCGQTCALTTPERPTSWVMATCCLTWLGELTLESCCLLLVQMTKSNLCDSLSILCLCVLQ